MKLNSSKMQLNRNKEIDTYTALVDAKPSTFKVMRLPDGGGRIPNKPKRQDYVVASAVLIGRIDSIKPSIRSMNHMLVSGDYTSSHYNLLLPRYKINPLDFTNIDDKPKDGYGNIIDIEKLDIVEISSGNFVSSRFRVLDTYVFTHKYDIVLELIV